MNHLDHLTDHHSSQNAAGEVDLPEPRQPAGQPHQIQRANAGEGIPSPDTYATFLDASWHRPGDGLPPIPREIPDEGGCGCPMEPGE